MNVEKLERLEERYSSVRSLERWKTSSFSYDSIMSFHAEDALKSGVHTVFYNEHPIDLFTEIKPGCPLVIVLNGAVPRSETLKLPVFAGFGVVPSGEVSRVSINDPSLYLDPALPLAWYAGSSDFPLQSLLPILIDTIRVAAQPTKVMFIGGSGGGFASLYYSRLMEDALALVWNPQTDILRYAEKFVQQYALTAFGMDGLEKVQADLPKTVETDLCRLYQAGHLNCVAYLQNRSDWHMTAHCEPFLRGLQFEGEVTDDARINQRARLYVRDWGNGHVAPPQPFLKALIANLLQEESSWTELFAQDHALLELIRKAEVSCKAIA